jgi:hypothetical protein
MLTILLAAPTLISNMSSITNVSFIIYGKLALTLLSRHDSKQEELVMPPAPPLYKKRQVPAQVFGFPVTEDDLSVWAERHNTPGEDDHYRRHSAWKAICSRLPRNHRRITIIRNPMAPYSQSMCFVVGTNFNAKDMEPAQNVELIKSLYDAIDMGNRPGWFYMSRG